MTASTTALTLRSPRRIGVVAFELDAEIDLEADEDLDGVERVEA